MGLDMNALGTTIAPFINLFFSRTTSVDGTCVNFKFHTSTDSAGIHWPDLQWNIS